MTEDFRNVHGKSVDTGIEFCLASKDPNGQPTTGINRIDGSGAQDYAANGIAQQGGNEETIKGLSNWDNSKYVNIWVVSEIGGNDGKQGVQGYATLPIDNISWINGRDGLVVIYNTFGRDLGITPNYQDPNELGNSPKGFRLKYYTNQNETATHEIGHYLNLLHPWGSGANGSCNEGNCNTEGDKVCDTPPTTANTDCGSPACGGTQAVHNYMDYTGEECVHEFSQGQADRMRAVLQSSRKGLVESDVCAAPFNLDAEVSAVFTPNEKVCSQDITPKIQLKNNGVSDLTTAVIEYGVVGEAANEHTWTGTIKSRKTAIIDLPQFTAVGTGNLNFYANVKTANGQSDEALSNNELENGFVISENGTAVEVSIQLDDLPDESTWSIFEGDPQDLTAFQNGIMGGPYGEDDAGNVVTQEVCLEEGCYNFGMWDHGSNGISGGSYKVETVEGAFELLNETGEFGQYSPHEICVTSKLPVANFSSDITKVCGNATVAYSDASENYAGRWEWTFEGGNPASSTDKSPIVSYSAPGEYKVTLKASNLNGDDTKEIDKYIRVVESPTAQASGEPIGCANECNGSVTVTPTGGTPPYSYVWDDPSNQQTETATNLCPGDYNVLVADAEGCTANTMATVDDKSLITITLDPTDATCDNNGKIEATVNGGTPPYTYAWTSGADTKDATGLSAGGHTLTVTDAEGCKNLEFATIEAGEGMELDFATTDVSCGNEDGTATVNPQGGTPPFQYKWSNGDDTEKISGLKAGNYIVEVTDSEGCVKEDEILVVNPDAPLLTTQSKDISCNGECSGEITSTAGGGDGNYSYSWSHDGSVTNESLKDLCSGTYELTVTDGQGCSTSSTVIIEEPEALDVEMDIVNADCGASNGSATLNVSGGKGPYTYTWNKEGSGNSLSGVPNDVYTVLILDANGCSWEQEVILKSPDQPDAEVTASEENICEGEEVTLTVSGGSNAKWSTGASESSIKVSPESTKTYTVTVSKNGCESNPAEVTINVIDAPTTKINTNEETLCEGEKLTLIASGGDTYKWSTGETSDTIVYTASSSTKITVEAVDNGCPGNMEEVNITVLPITVKAKFDADQKRVDLQKNPYVKFTNESTGDGDSYFWDFGDGNHSTLKDPKNMYTEPGTYEVILKVIKDGCTSEYKITIVVEGDQIDPWEVEELDPAKLIDVYPNPTTGVLNIKLNNDYRLRIMNSTGKLLTEFGSNNRDLITIDLSGYSRGIYFLEIKNDTDRIIKKIVLN